MERISFVGVPQERLAESRMGKNSHEEGLRGAEEAEFDVVLEETVRALETAQVPYALMGGIASTTFGRPRWTHDIDVFVRPHDAERALDALEQQGFSVERTDPTWLFKAFKDNVMVDIIFRSTGNIYFDDDMIDRSVRSTFHGHSVRLLPPEDLLIMKAVVHNEIGPRHWHDALGIIARTELDWGYLLKRAQRAPRRVLSLLLYAHSLDLQVPNHTIRKLFEQTYGE